MKNSVLLFLFSTLILCGCGLDAKNSNPAGDDFRGRVCASVSAIRDWSDAGKVHGVKLMVWNRDSNRYDVLAEDIWNEGFDMEFPAPLDQIYLSEITPGWSEEHKAALRVSNPAARFSGFDTYLGVYSAQGAEIGQIEYGPGEGTWSVHFIYCDSDCHIKGAVDGGDENVRFDLELHAGWNRIAVCDFEEGELNEMIYTTSMPQGSDWFFWVYNIARQ